MRKEKKEKRMGKKWCLSLEWIERISHNPPLNLSVQRGGLPMSVWISFRQEEFFNFLKPLHCKFRFDFHWLWGVFLTTSGAKIENVQAAINLFGAIGLDFRKFLRRSALCQWKLKHKGFLLRIRLQTKYNGWRLQCQNEAVLNSSTFEQCPLLLFRIWLTNIVVVAVLLLSFSFANKNYVCCLQSPHAVTHAYKLSSVLPVARLFLENRVRFLFRCLLCTWNGFDI